MVRLFNSRDIKKDVVGWLCDMLNNWDKTLVLVDEKDVLVDTILYYLWMLGFPLAATTDTDNINIEAYSFKPPSIEIPMLFVVNKDDRRFSFWEKVLTERGATISDSPETLEIEDIMQVRVAVVSASKFNKEMLNWEVVFVLLMDTNDLSHIPPLEYAIYVVPTNFSAFPLPKITEAGDIILQPPQLIPFSALQGGFLRWKQRKPVGAILDPNLNSEDEIDHYIQVLSTLDIPIVSYDDAVGFKAILYPVNPALVNTGGYDHILRVAGRMVPIFTTDLLLAASTPLFYFSVGWGNAISCCVQAFQTFMAQQSNISEVVLKTWLSYLEIATEEGFVLTVLKRAFSLAHKYWGLCLPPSIFG